MKFLFQQACDNSFNKYNPFLQQITSENLDSILKLSHFKHEKDVSP